MLGLGDLAADGYITIRLFFTSARDGTLCRNMIIWLIRGWKGAHRKLFVKAGEVKIGGRIEYPGTSKNSTVTVVNYSRTAM